MAVPNKEEVKACLDRVLLELKGTGELTGLTLKVARQKICDKGDFEMDTIVSMKEDIKLWVLQWMEKPGNAPANVARPSGNGKRSRSKSQGDDNFSPESKKRKLSNQKKSSSTSGNGNTSDATKCTAEVKKDSENNNYIELSNARRATKSSFKGREMLNIREWYQADGDCRPGKKGLALTKDQAEILKANFDRIFPLDGCSDEVGPFDYGEAEIKKDHEGNEYIDLSNAKRATNSAFKGKQMLNIREWYEKDGKWLPGGKGISLSAEQAKILRDNILLVMPE